ncbi:DUF4440 domain-containing protein [Streptomyces showdoensis]|uniref:Acetyltransferase, ribosomal protein N-acetylase n=1 Tax=Streptomyces showdoensis TaxID=68268 RepID=A0A2P2GIL8_STREW|nr:DUF4440 domain-containing protein [Streptomyces showdoensis]KKZ71360.1 acetyltransferase, ribosomal protein N-acetylase [Streptomyces showdoensis]
MHQESEEDAIAAALAGELRLMDPSVRVSADEARRLLDPEFVEVGASGRRWTYEEMLAALPELAGGDPRNGPRYEPSGLRGVLLAPGLVHVTYETVIDGRRARRSSLWRKGAGPGDAGWRMYYHQGTPVADG